MGYEHFILQYGYWALAVGIVFEGETILVISGFAAHQQYMSLAVVILIASVGSLAMDQVFFLLGRFRAQPMLKRHGSWTAYIERVRRMIARRPDALAVGFRFLYGFRLVTPFAVGFLSEMDWRRFFLLNALGALLWSVVFSLAGYLFGRALETFFGDVKHYEHWVMLGLLIFGALSGAVYCRRRRAAYARR